MRAVVQRVTRADVTVDGIAVGSIDHGLVVLIAVVDSDTVADGRALVDKLVGLRMFGDDAGQMNRSVVEVGGSVLVVSQFTLAADVKRGRRPSFTSAADPELARPLIDTVVDRFAAAGVRTETGRFGARMAVSLVNDGPVTFIVETRDGAVLSWNDR